MNEMLGVRVYKLGVDSSVLLGTKIAYASCVRQRS